MLRIYINILHKGVVGTSALNKVESEKLCVTRSISCYILVYILSLYVTVTLDLERLVDFN